MDEQSASGGGGGNVGNQEESQVTSLGDDQTGGEGFKHSRFVIAWVCLIILGITIEFLGRLFGYEDNPTPIFHVWMPQLTASLSVIVGLAGFFTLQSGTTKHSTLRRRNGALLITVAAFMLLCSFAFKPIIPLIFG